VFIRDTNSHPYTEFTTPHTQTGSVTDRR